MLFISSIICIIACFSLFHVLCSKLVASKIILYCYYIRKNMSSAILIYTFGKNNSNTARIFKTN